LIFEAALAAKDDEHHETYLQDLEARTPQCKDSVLSIDFGRSIAFVVDDLNGCLSMSVIAGLSIVSACPVRCAAVAAHTVTVPQEELTLMLNEAGQIDPSLGSHLGSSTTNAIERPKSISYAVLALLACGF
jgi:hypothetical protein